MTTTPEPGNQITARVLQIVERHPGLSASQIALMVSGATHAVVKRALERLLEKNKLRREKRSCYVWFVGEQAQRLPGRTKNIFTTYTPPPPIVTRVDAFDHQRAMSLRGDGLKPHTPPLSMCVGKLSDTRSHEGVTFRPEPKTPPVKAAPAPRIDVRASQQQVRAFERLHDDATVARVRELRQQGLSYAQITKATGVSRGSAYRWCADMDSMDNNRMPPRQKPPQQPINAPKRRKQPWEPGATA